VVTKDELSRRLEAAAAQTPQPEIHIEPDMAAAFPDVAHVMSVARRFGLTKMGVVGGT
jgi:biopolymer transport protein ExbD